jgi:hypothetical protein
MNRFKTAALVCLLALLTGSVFAQGFITQPVPGFQSGFDRGINVGISGQPATGFPTGFNVGISGGNVNGFPTGFNTGINGNFRGVNTSTAFFRNQQAIQVSRFRAASAGGVTGFVSPNGTINFVPNAALRSANSLNFVSSGGSSIFGNLGLRLENARQERQNVRDFRSQQLRQQNQQLKQQSQQLRQQNVKVQQFKVQKQQNQHNQQNQQQFKVQVQVQQLNAKQQNQQQNQHHHHHQQQQQRQQQKFIGPAAVIEVY